MIGAVLLAVTVLVLIVVGVGCACVLGGRVDDRTEKDAERTEKDAERDKYYTNLAGVYQHPRRHQ